MNRTVYLASSVSAYQISGRNFKLVGDNVTTRTLDLLDVTLRVYVTFELMNNYVILLLRALCI